MERPPVRLPVDHEAHRLCHQRPWPGADIAHRVAAMHDLGSICSFPGVAGSSLALATCYAVTSAWSCSTSSSLSASDWNCAILHLLQAEKGPRRSAAYM